MGVRTAEVGRAVSGTLRAGPSGFAAAALVLGLAWSSSALAQTSATRTSSFAYDAGSGLLTQEVIEPNLSAYRLQTDYTYNAFGQKTQVTVSGVDITTRSASTTYDTRGQFATSATNALNQSESWQYGARFGLPTSHTGPNGLTTTWTYDTFGRKTLEVRADGTRTAWSYQFCSGIAGGTASCPAGGTYLVQTAQLASDGTTQIGPTSTAYFDQLGRTIAADTQGFDGSLVRTATQYDSQGRVLQKSRPYFVSGGTPKWTSYTYDTLSRVLTETHPDASATSYAYHGLTTSVTNALSQTSTTVTNSQGQTVSVTDALSHSTTYVYEPFRNPTQVTDVMGNVTILSYDTRGRKISHSDPDMGAWSYTYNVLDQLTSHSNAAGQVTSVSYDLLGRTTQRTEPDLTSTWTYDGAAHGVGKLASAATNTGYSRSHSYDTLGRPSAVQLTIDSSNYTITNAYDGASRVSSVAYPSGFAVAYAYNSVGYQTQLSDSATAQVYWTANTRDAEGHLTQQTAGNGVATSQTFDTNTGLLTGISAGSGGTVASFGYGYDTLGKLLSRSDANTSLSETFGYDSLNRLTSTSVNLSPTPLNKTFIYDTIGNLTSKSDVGSYTYPIPGQPRPHGVTSISGSISTTFTYDAKGNMTAGNGLTVSYASYNKPSSITRGTSTIGFSHDPDHQRFKQVAPGGTTLYLGSGGAAAEKFTGSGGAVTWTNYLVAAGGLVGMHVENVGGSTLTRYFHKDHLGSIAVITNESGTVLERLSYDAWGKRRYSNGADDPAGAITSQTNRGFTGHEELDQVGLVHMNGRVYDPLLARFGTPDPTTESPFSTQGWNRYSYVGNSPLNFTDPSGYCFMGCFWQPIFKAIQNLFRQFPILGTIIQIAAGAICGPVCAIAASTIVAGITSGKLGLALRAGFITAVTFGIAEFAQGLVGDLGGAFAAGADSGSGGNPIDWGSRSNLAGPGYERSLELVAPPAPVATGVMGATVGAPNAYAYVGASETSMSLWPSLVGGAANMILPEPPLRSYSQIQLAQAFPPVQLFARPPIVTGPRGGPLTPLERLPPGSADGPGAGKAFPRSLNDEPEGTPCIYCVEPTTREPGPNRYHGEHVIPKSRGGNNLPENHAPSCQTCNLSKGPRTPEEWYEYLQRGGT
jgi:RHS repeat-associated protein